jgi:signal transduction histidine kinase
VTLTLQLRKAQATTPSHLDELESELSGIVDGLMNVVDELRTISHGIHPAILSEGGLEPALRTLARRSAIPVRLELRVGRRLPEPVEVATYYLVSEALTNAVKHAHASAVKVELDTHDALLELAIHDDGIGGADPARGSGLVGLTDRIEALGGTLSVSSKPWDGTHIHAEIPLSAGTARGSSPPARMHSASAT